MYRQSQAEMRVMVFAPVGRDATLLDSTLQSVGIEGKVVGDVEELLKEFRAGVGTAILAQEAIRRHLRGLGEFLAEQPPWSDLPLIILTYGRPHHLRKPERG